MEKVTITGEMIDKALAESGVYLPNDVELTRADALEIHALFVRVVSRVDGSHLTDEGARGFAVMLDVFEGILEEFPELIRTEIANRQPSTGDQNIVEAYIQRNGGLTRPALIESLWKTDELPRLEVELHIDQLVASGRVRRECDTKIGEYRHYHFTDCYQPAYDAEGGQDG